MKTLIKTFIFVSLMTVLAVSCRDRDAEKKIAQLESRIAELESGKTEDAPAPVTPAAQTQEVKPEGPLPVMEFASTSHDFGPVDEGQVVEYTYKFKNTGEEPLVIQHAQGSCGCTASDWSKEPVPVGGTGFVTAKFDTKGKTGYQEKTVTVTANTWPKQTTLKFKAMVKAKDGAATQ